MICVYGLSKTLGPIAWIDGHISNEIASQIDKEIMNITSNSYVRCKYILSENIDLVHMLAQELIKKETLTAEEVYKLIQQ